MKFVTMRLFAISFLAFTPASAQLFDMGIHVEAGSCAATGQCSVVQDAVRQSQELTDHHLRQYRQAQAASDGAGHAQRGNDAGPPQVDYHNAAPKSGAKATASSMRTGKVENSPKVRAKAVQKPRASGKQAAATVEAVQLGSTSR